MLATTYMWQHNKVSCHCTINWPIKIKTQVSGLYVELLRTQSSVFSNVRARPAHWQPSAHIYSQPQPICKAHTPFVLNRSDQYGSSSIRRFRPDALTIGPENRPDSIPWLFLKLYFFFFMKFNWTVNIILINVKLGWISIHTGIRVWRGWIYHGFFHCKKKFSERERYVSS